MIIDEPTETLPETSAVDEASLSNYRYKALIIAGICLSLMLHSYLAQLFLIWGMSYTQRVIVSEMLEWVCAGMMPG